VTLTPVGEQVLVRARELLALHDQTLRELQGFTSRIVVDVVGHGLTPKTVLSAARRRGPDVEYFAEFQGGLELALPLLQARRLDVTFGRLAGVTAATDGAFAERLIRLERSAATKKALPGHSARSTTRGGAVALADTNGALVEDVGCVFRQRQRASSSSAMRTRSCSGRSAVSS
jgi:DNA-binding transcriptional LysR family regulator